MSYLDIVNKVTDEYNTAYKKMQKDGEKALKVLFMNVFRDIPELEEVYWDQYTVYFNDGDTCNFRVYDPSFVFKNIDNDELDLEDCHVYEEPGEWLRKNYPNDKRIAAYDNLVKTRGKETVEAVANKVKEFTKAFRSLPNDVFLGVFDDHKTVRATRNGFDVADNTSHD